MLTVHHLSVSQSERILWLCEELNLSYNLVKHTRDPITSPTSLSSIPGNSTGKAPFIEDSDTNITLGESGAIVEYIVSTYGAGQLTIAPGDKGYTEYLHWLYFAPATLQTAMICSMFVGMVQGVPITDPAKQFAEQRLASTCQVLDNRLASSEWLAGEEFTIADIMTVFSLTTQRYWGPLLSLAPYPNVLRYLKNCTGRPAYQRAMEKGDPEMRVLISAEAPAESLIAAGGVTSELWKK